MGCPPFPQSLQERMQVITISSVEQVLSGRSGHLAIGLLIMRMTSECYRHLGNI